MVQACGGRSGAQRTAWPLVAAMTQPPPAGAPAKKHVRLQERRGSSVALVLDVRSLGAVEPICSVNTPREVTLHFLRTAGRPLTPWALQHQPPSPQQLEEEFLKIPPNFVNPEDLDIPGRASKDRYKTILPNPQSRVCLGRAQSREAGGYINANYIRGYDGQEKVYIATQGPMPNTVLDFWEMVWQEGASVIVMLTQLRESKEKCVHYWPTEEDTYGPFRIRVQEERELPEYSVRRFTIQHQEQCRLVRHVLFSAWPDHQTPESAGPLLRLVAEVEDSLETAASTGPIVVHCSAGIGRTGCFIATRIGCQQLKARGEVDILGIVCQLRLDRGGMIQTAEQYQFLHRTLALYAAQLPGSPAPEPWRPPPAWAGGPSDLQTPGWPRGRGAPSVSVGSQDTDQPRPPPDTRSSPLAVPLLPLVAPSGPQGEPACASVCGTGAGLSADLGEPPGAL